MEDSIKNLTIPNELNHPYFFDGNNDKVMINQKDAPINIYFIHEILFYNGIKATKPWLIPIESISTLLEKWTILKEELKLLHQQRDQHTILQEMKKGIALFIQFLFWSNNRPVQLNPIPYDQMSFKPVNIQERLEFLIIRPRLYHSYVQLSELFEEQQKHFVRKNIMKKASRS